MNLSQVRLFVKLNESEFNLSVAAKELHIVQSAASRQLKLLEDELKTPLFVRNGKRLTGLTEVGEKVLGYAYDICLAQKNIIAVAQAINDNRMGVIRLGTTHTQARYLLPGVLELFKKEYPLVRLHIEESSPESLYKMLLADKIDLVICSELYQDDNALETYEMYEWEHVLIAPFNHSIWEQEINLKIITEYPVLSYKKGFTRSEKIFRVLKQQKVDFEFDVLASDADVIKFYVKKNFGIGIIAQMAYDSLNDLHLKTHFLGNEIGFNKAYCSTLRKRVMPDYIKSFIKVFRDFSNQQF